MQFHQKIVQMRVKSKIESYLGKEIAKSKSPNTDSSKLCVLLLSGAISVLHSSLLSQRVENSILVSIIHPNNFHTKHPKHLLTQTKHCLFLDTKSQNQNQPIYFVAYYLELLCARLSITKTEMLRKIICRSRNTLDSDT